VFPPPAPAPRTWSRTAGCPTLWSINSIGEIDYSGHQMLVTVLSDDNSSEASGIATIQAVAQQAVSAVAGG
jgi:hypothetical protein